MLKKGTNVLPASVEYVEDAQTDTYKAILRPGKPLKLGVTYTATATTAATDNPLDAEKSWTFKTRRR